MIVRNSRQLARAVPDVDAEMPDLARRGRVLVVSAKHPF